MSQIAREKNSSQGIRVEQLAKPFNNNKNKKKKDPSQPHSLY